MRAIAILIFVGIRMAISINALHEPNSFPYNAINDQKRALRKPPSYHTSAHHHVSSFNRTLNRNRRNDFSDGGGRLYRLHFRYKRNHIDSVTLKFNVSTVS